MSDIIIRTENLTRDYTKGRGIFNLNINIMQGECFGFVGTNGSGKTTTLRSIMGFIRPDFGGAYVKGMDAWKYSVETKKYIGYVPGEIGFPSECTGLAFLKKQAEYMKISDLSNMFKLLDLFKLDPEARLGRMSKGMKQKTALVAAFMGDKEILILDEPATGLDPLMRETFIDYIANEKKRGKTILISDHIFEEIEELCDRTVFIRDGHIIDTVSMNEFHGDRRKSIFHIGFKGGSDELILNSENCSADNMFQILKNKDVSYIKEEAYTLKDRFREIYMAEEKK